MNRRTGIVSLLVLAAPAALLMTDWQAVGQRMQLSTREPAGAARTIKELRSQVDAMHEQLSTLDNQLRSLEAELSGESQADWRPAENQFLAINRVAGGEPHELSAALGIFTTEGAVPDSLRPVDHEVKQVVVDPEDGRLYALGNHRVLELDRNTLEMKELSIDPTLPRLSWSCGLAFDAARRRVVVASLGGEGFLYAFDTAKRQWSLIGSLQNTDLAALAYDAASDQFVGLEVDHNGGVHLHSYTPAGARTATREISKLIAPHRLHQFDCQLSIVGNQALVIASPGHFGNDGAVQPKVSTVIPIDLASAASEDKRFAPISLRDWANQSLDEPFHLAHMAQNTLGDLPRGSQELDGVTFQIDDACIQLAGTWKGDVPAATDPIAVSRRASQLHFLHATGWGEGREGEQDLGYIADGTKIGAYHVRYDSGEVTEVPIIYGQDLRGWWKFSNDLPPTTATVAWEGMNGTAREWGVSLRLYRFTWKNPRPEEVIESIRFESVNESIAAPFLVAVTAEQKPSERSAQ